jgi:2-C-methyl-D-erythritol 2,4-cyclodiphosphate synthase
VQRTDENRKEQTQEAIILFRIGIGNDFHRLVEGRPLVLGGVQIAHDRGAAGHSDADALLHAIADAILGALCEGDLGVHFPDQDEQWKDSDSLQLLSRVMWLAGERGFHVVNVDATVILEAPKLRPYVLSMREKIAQTLGIDLGCISIKAKTNEGLDAVGRGEAVAAQAVALLGRTE